MNDNLKRYMFIGEFDPTLTGFFSRRGEVIWLSSFKQALSQTGEFTLIIVDAKIIDGELPIELLSLYSHTPILISGSDKKINPPSQVRFVNLEEIFDHQIEKEEKLARTELKVEELRKVHSDAKNVLILLHDQPDPDAIASALALSTLLKRNRQTAIIAYMGEKISRPENVTMVKLLDVTLHEIKPEDLQNYDSIAMVDVQPPFFGDLIINVDSVIDHHPRGPSYNAKFTHVSSVEGATSTILTSYLRAAQVEISERLATALLYGIKSDTLTLNRDANADDIDSFTFLYPLANLTLLRKIEMNELPPSELQCFGRALVNHWIEDDICFINLGRVEEEYLIPRMADFAIQIEGVQWSVVFGILSGTHLVISIRNVGYVKSAGRLVRVLFKDIGSAGGHRSAAKAVISLKQIRKVLGKSSQSAIKKWITETMSQAVKEENNNQNGN